MESKKTLRELFEKLYFHEIEAREKINGRLQLPMVLIISMLGAIAYMLQNLQRSYIDIWTILFLATLAATAVFLCIAIYNFIRSWFGNTYDFLPTPIDSSEYLNLLNTTYAEFDEKNQLIDQYLDEYLYDSYIHCATKNASCNDKRSIYLHKSHGYIITTSVSLLICFIVFYFGSLEKKPSKDPIQVSIQNLDFLKGVIMTESQTPKVENPQQKPTPKKIPPPPPKPPTPRQIREGIEIIPSRK